MSVLRSIKSKNVNKDELKQACSTVASGLHTTLRIAKEAVGHARVPGLQEGITGVLFAIDVIKRTSQNVDDIRKFGNQVEDLNRVLEKSKREGTFSPAVVERVNHLFISSNTSLEELCKIASRSLIERLFHYKDDTRLVSEHIQSIQSFTAESIVAIEFSLGKPRLPPELTDIIIALLSSNPATLRACSLVCKNWLPASRCRLFSTVTLRSRKRTDALVELLATPSSTIAKYAHTLSFQNLISETFQPLSTITQPLEKLVGIKTLILQGHWNPIREWEIERLSLWFAKITTLDIQPRLEIYNSPNEFSAFLSLFSSLRVLHLQACKTRGWGDGRLTLSLFSSLRAIHIDCRRGMNVAWLIPYVKSSAVGELRLSPAGVEDLPWMQQLLHSCGPSIQLLDMYLPYRDTGVVQILRRRLDLSCLPNLQVLWIGILNYRLPRDWYNCNRPYSGDDLSELVSQITSEHMTKVTLQLESYQDEVDDVLKLTNWTRLARTLSHPRFARLQRVEIILAMLDSCWPDCEANEWISRLRGKMGVLYSRGCLFVSVRYRYGYTH